MGKKIGDTMQKAETQNWRAFEAVQGAMTSPLLSSAAPLRIPFVGLNPEAYFPKTTPAFRDFVGTCIPLVLLLIGIAVIIAGTLASPLIYRGPYYELPIQSDSNQGERVEISKFEPRVTLKGWNDEYAIVVLPQFPGKEDDHNAIPASRTLFSNRIEYRTEDSTVFVEPRTKNEFDIDFILDKKPDTNVFTYRIEGAEEFDFWRQPALSEMPLEEGVEYCTDTQCVDVDGTVVEEQPENVIDSYAVYHKTKQNHKIGATNYKTGKIFHIYRPKAVDARGNEVWARMSYQDNVLSVTVPQEFLDTATYPVVVDPTIGYTSSGGSSRDLCLGSGTSRRLGRKVTAVENGTVSSASILLDTDAGTPNVTTSLFLNTENTGTDSHNQVAFAEDTFSITTTDDIYYTTATAAGSFSSGVVYIISASCDWTDLANGREAKTRRDLSGQTGQYVEDFGSYAASQEDPWTDSSSTDDRIFSLYFTYSAVSDAPARRIRLFEGFTIKLPSGRIMVR